MDIIHPNVPETIKRLADAYEYLVESGGASIAYSLLPTSGKMSQRSSALSVAAGRGDPHGERRR